MRWPIVLAMLLALAGSSLLGGGAVASVRAQAATPGADCPATTPEQNEALVRRWLDEVWHEGNPAVVDEVLAEDYVLHLPSRPGSEETGDAAAETRIRELILVDFPDLQIEIEDVIAADDLVASRSIWTGTHSDELEQHGELGVPATGQRVAWTGHALSRIACGQIAEQWVSNDALGQLQQLGAIPDPRGVAGMAGMASTPTAEGAVGTPGADCAATTPAENEALVRRFYDEVYNGQNLALVDELYAEDHRFHQPNQAPAAPGDDLVEAGLAEWLSDLPDAQTTVETVVAAGDNVAVRWRTSATYQGDFEQAGIPGNGRPVMFEGITFFHIGCGEIAETWIAWDGLGVYRQLTADPGAATPAP